MCQVEHILVVGLGLVLWCLSHTLAQLSKATQSLGNCRSSPAAAAARRSMQAPALAFPWPLLPDGLPLPLPLPPPPPPDFPFAPPFAPLPTFPAPSACVRRALYSSQCLSFSGSAPPPGHLHSLLPCSEDLQMKQFFSSVGNPACWKWQETPRLHSPFCHALHGCAQEDSELESRAATGWGVAAADGAQDAVAAATALAAFFLSPSFCCTCRAR